ncbi:MAG: GatB/YqeY domain-containing protein [Candidatus Nealsonbacteria bacterium]|nr:GatB/YqeY domain-containing protein [Candidatus Nealsonbacteria bacterium]
MELKEKIRLNLNSALKEKRTLEVLVLRQLLAAILNKEKEKRFKAKEEKDIQLTDEEVIEVISSEAKKRRESIFEFGKGKRQDLVEKEKKELEILEKYLPEQLPEEEIRKLIKDAIEKTDAKEIKDMGKVMAELMPKIKGKADGTLVSKIVKELLET